MIKLHFTLLHETPNFRKKIGRCSHRKRDSTYRKYKRGYRGTCLVMIFFGGSFHCFIVLLVNDTWCSQVKFSFLRTSELTSSIPRCFEITLLSASWKNKKKKCSARSFKRIFEWRTKEEEYHTMNFNVRIRPAIRKKTRRMGASTRTTDIHIHSHFPFILQKRGATRSNSVNGGFLRIACCQSHHRIE